MSRENTHKWAIYLVLVLFLVSLVVASTYLIFYGADFHIKGDEVAVIHVQGVMLTGSAPAGIGIATSEDITTSLRNANEDDRIRAVVLRVNSPGGSPAAAQEIIREIKKMDKPVVVSMGDVAASAAYYISAPADKIFANPGTITGSIGVIWTFKNKTSFYEEEGVEHYIAKSGEFKDMGADWRGLTDAEKIYADKTILEVYDRFVTEVAQGRNLTKSEVKDIADGRIYTGSKAKKLGLVDELGNLYDAVDDAAKLADIEGTPVITYLNKPSLARILFGSEEAKHFTSYYTDNNYGQLHTSCTEIASN